MPAMNYVFWSIELCLYAYMEIMLVYVYLLLCFV